MEIIFMPSKKKWIGEPGRTVMTSAAEIGIALDGNCAGKGTCGKCKVYVISGEAGEMADEELRLLTKAERDGGCRLACMLRAESDLCISVPMVEGAAARKADLVELEQEIELMPQTIKKHIHIEPPSLKDQSSYVQRILDAAMASNITPAAMRSIAPEKGVEMTVFVRAGEVIDIRYGDVECHLGIAFDIGTTTVVGYLWNLETDERLAAVAKTNLQGTYGADVISRIDYAGEDDNHLKVMQNAVVSCLNEIILDMQSIAATDMKNVYDVTMVGNTTMAHLLLGVTPSSLSRAPFAPIFGDLVQGRTVELGLNYLNENARFFLLPNIAGHVGSDITAGLLATGMLDAGKASILLDIGTNGEVVVTNGGRALACSTAAGPAFEGASISCGMRAAKGAIEYVKIEEGNLNIKVIDDAEPIGLCGSGIIDAVAELLSAGIVDKTGKILDSDKLRANGVPDELIRRVRRDGKTSEFVLADGGAGTAAVEICNTETATSKVSITQKDIREVQLAKAAIAAGISILMGELGICESELDRVFIAGAFGNHIRIDSAMKIGLIPNIDKSKILSVGNAAGVGAGMALRSSSKMKETDELAKAAIHVELAVKSDFQDKYIGAMTF